MLSVLEKIDRKNPKIMVLGDIMLDRFIYGTVNRISPEAPVPVVNFIKEYNTLGGCGNVVRNLSNLDVGVVVIGAVGADNYGKLVEGKLENLNIDTNRIVQKDKLRTTHKMRIIAQGQHVVRVDWDGDQLEESDYQVINRYLKKDISRMDALIISDYGKTLCRKDVVQFAISKAIEIGIPVFVDPKGSNWEKYKGATAIKPNTKEISTIVEYTLKTDDDFVKAGKDILKDFCINHCLITRGKEGMTLISENESSHIPAQTKEVYDVSGAGDTVISCLSAAVAAGVDLREAVDFANAAAGLVVGHMGTTAINRKELEEL
jgi:D-beta-D-heptose 7-phosphate kinase/D-beta-D-heptose 1-phosphate adenosyltransferase|tara:strand:- start:2954 stop:3907 length:954 start_codon:yes stop_codon:yes gene_type:complete